MLSSPDSGHNPLLPKDMDPVFGKNRETALCDWWDKDTSALMGRQNNSYTCAYIWRTCVFASFPVSLGPFLTFVQFIACIRYRSELEGMRYLITIVILTAVFEIVGSIHSRKELGRGNDETVTAESLDALEQFCEGSERCKVRTSQEQMYKIQTL